jgi:hypothetical protein
MDPLDTEGAMKGNRVSRRWLLRNTINLTAGVVAASSTAAAAAATPDPPETLTPDHDPVTGEIFDRDRHHHWDTV